MTQTRKFIFIIITAPFVAIAVAASALPNWAVFVVYGGYIAIVFLMLTCVPEPAKDKKDDSSKTER